MDEAGRVLPDVGHDIHADDLDRVVELALREHPDTPAAIAGTSLGAVISMHYNATRNTHGLPVLALAPVVLDRFLPFGDKLKFAASLVSSRASESLVATPMSRGIRMTTNAASEYVTHADEMSHLRVPVRIFRDVARMDLDIARHGGDVGGATRVVLGGADEVSVNRLASVLGRRAGATVETISGAPHELSQEWNDPRVVDAFADAALSAPLPR
jgi:alpha-beta hydrolase superfamily lysophospholipase